MDLKQRAKNLKTDIPALFLALKDKNTPIIAKVFVGITVACFVWIIKRYADAIVLTP